MLLKKFIQNIFSVKNNDTRKVITILGMKFKFKSKALVKVQQEEKKYNELINKIDSLSDENKIILDALNKIMLNISHNDFIQDKQQTNKKTILYIERNILQPDTNAGDRASLSYIKALINKGYTVKYLPANRENNTAEKYKKTIRDLGVEIIADTTDCYNEKYVTDWFRINGSYIDYVVINRPMEYEMFIDSLKSYVPQAVILYMGHDIHFLRLKRMQMTQESDALTSQINQYEKIEHKIWDDNLIILYFSKEEINIVNEYNPNAKAMTVPLFLYSDFEKINYNPSQREDLLFVGGFKHIPNADAMRWFIKDIFPFVLKNNPRIKLNIVGSNCPEDLLKMANDNIIFHGYISDDDLQALYDKTKIVISPLQYGAGVKGKIIEAMKNQIPVITTDIGAEGINSDLLTVANDEETFAQAILNLYTDDENLMKISDESYNFIKNNFSEEFIGNLIEYVNATAK